MKTVLTFFVNCFVAVFLAMGSQELPSCSQIVYEDHNQINPKPIKLHAISGVAKDEQGNPISEVCIAIFSERDHRLIASIETKNDGRFALERVPPGRYRLIARHPALCSANVPLIVASGQSRSKKSLTLHMVVGGIDKCSYGDLAGP